MEALLADPVPESLGARWPAEESTAVADELGGGEQLALMVDEPPAVPGATAAATGSLEMEAGVADAAPESGAEKLVVLEE